MKRLIASVMSLMLTAACAGCSRPAPPPPQPDITQMRQICDLSVMECYYHNVAKYFEEDASGILWWQKDRHFWVEYSGIVSVGIDVSQLSMDVHGNEIVITLPPAKILNSKVEEGTLRYIEDASTAHIHGANEVTAVNAAQEQLEQAAASDQIILTEAETRIKALLSNYIDTIAGASDQPYTLRFESVSDTVSPVPDATASPEPSATPE